MDKYIMKKTSFFEICKLLDENEGDISKCINGLFEIALLFLPGLVCKDVAFIMNLANGATILGAKPIIENAIKNIKNIFNNKKYEDFSTKYEHAQIAQVLIVYAAYFDTVKEYLPDVERKINISQKEKLAITKESVSRYMSLIEQNMSKDAERNVKDILDYELPLPNPVETLEESVISLKKFYNILNEQLMNFYASLDFFDMMSESKKDRFVSIIRELPNRAVKNYEKQYYQLAITFNDFFVWTNIEEHKNIQKRLDIGFEEISKCITEYCEKSAHSRAVNTLENYRKKYSAYIETSVVDVSEMKEDSADGIIFPSKREIFVPQSFKTLMYKKDMHLEDKAVWARIDDWENIGKFIGDVLRHSISGSLPLLIFGHPGAGKSLLCNMLAAQILCHEYHVIIVKMRDSNAEQTIMQQINEQIERDFSNGCLWSEIAESQLYKPLLIVFDGYDELLQASGKAYSDYLQRIVEFQENQKILGISVKCIVTSRVTLIDKAEIMKNTPVIMLSDFDKERVRQWSKVWNEKNREYFIHENLKEFSISHSDRVFELAKQPLLLLMLALYDANDNALKRNRSMSETQLYDNLIREFISREKRKDGRFKSLLKDEKDRLIAREMKKISIAALGMYNRKKLYIRAGELEKDLDFILQEKKRLDDLRYSELSESEKLVGSFFFIHKSNATDVVNRERISSTAYEFLHNTFGEYLTANCVVKEMQKIISWIRTLVESDREEQWELGNQRAWVSGMAYTPLFSRPVIIRMIHDWASKYFIGKKREEVNVGLNNLLDFEIPNIISGNVLFDLKEVMEEKENPYTHGDLLKHAAIYSANLMILRTIIFDNEYRFRFDDETWNKIFAIWKYAFSEDELLNFSNQFILDKASEGYEMKYTEKRTTISRIPQIKIAKYMQINSILGNDASYGIAGALIGESNTNKVIEAISRNQLNISARYLWNYSLNMMLYSSYNLSDLMDTIYYMNKRSRNEDDIVYILWSSILLDKLLKNKIINYKQDNNDKIIEMIMGLVEYIGEYSFSNNEMLLKLALDTILNLLEYVQFDIADSSRLIRGISRRHHFGVNEESCYVLKIMTKAMEKVSDREKETLPELSNFNGFIEKLIDYIFSSVQKNSKTAKQVIESLKVLDDYMMVQNDKYMTDTNCFMIEEMIFECFRKRRGSFDVDMMLIKSIYILQKYGREDIDDRIPYLLNETIRRLDVERLYYEEPTIFFDLLTIVNSGSSYCVSEQMIRMVMWIVENKWKQLSIMEYRQICKFAEITNNDELRVILQQLVG